ncbi:MAG: hypothetical protein EXR11_02595 [Rhodospirillaceae bacterium]|nr:hypothetical protein [Rhodospirillaceae bacterium]
MVPAATPAEADTSDIAATAISRAALQRHEEAVFEIKRDGAINALNPLAIALKDRLAEADQKKIIALAQRALDQERAIVDLVDVGAEDSVQHLQVTLVPIQDRASAYCFVRDLTLDYSLRRALVDSRRRYRDFVEISSDFTWETGADRKFAYVTPHGALGYSADQLLAMDPGMVVAGIGGGQSVSHH